MSGRTREQLQRANQMQHRDNERLARENRELRKRLEDALRDPATCYGDALSDAIELAAEGWSYASDYFREKWDFEVRIEALRALLPTQRQGTDEERSNGHDR